MAVFWGVAIIGLSGLVLWFPAVVTHVLPGWVINVAHVDPQRRGAAGGGLHLRVPLLQQPLPAAEVPVRPGDVLRTHHGRRAPPRARRALRAHGEARRAGRHGRRGEWPRWKIIINPFGIAAIIIGLLLAARDLLRDAHVGTEPEGLRPFGASALRRFGPSALRGAGRRRYYGGRLNVTSPSMCRSGRTNVMFGRDVLVAVRADLALVSTGCGAGGGSAWQLPHLTWLPSTWFQTGLVWDPPESWLPTKLSPWQIDIRAGAGARVERGLCAERDRRAREGELRGARRVEVTRVLHVLGHDVALVAGHGARPVAARKVRLVRAHAHRRRGRVAFEVLRRRGLFALPWQELQAVGRHHVDHAVHVQRAVDDGLVVLAHYGAVALRAVVHLRVGRCRRRAVAAIAGQRLVGVRVPHRRRLAGARLGRMAPGVAAGERLRVERRVTPVGRGNAREDDLRRFGAVDVQRIQHVRRDVMALLALERPAVGRRPRGGSGARRRRGPWAMCCPWCRSAGRSSSRCRGTRCTWASAPRPCRRRAVRGARRRDSCRPPRCGRRRSRLSGACGCGLGGGSAWQVPQVSASLRGCVQTGLASRWQYVSEQRRIAELYSGECLPSLASEPKVISAGRFVSAWPGSVDILRHDVALVALDRRMRAAWRTDAACGRRRRGTR